MNRILLLVLFVLSYCVGSSQAISQRGTTAVTVQDARLFAQYNFRPPAFQDTVAANLQIGLDSCGALIFSRDINAYYFRACSPKRWLRVGGSAETDSAYVTSAAISNNAFILCRSSGTCDTILLIDTLMPPPISYETRLVSGNAVWDTLLNYNVTNCSYFILGRFFTSLATTVTLAAADSSNPRIDVIYLDTLGNVGVLTGIPSPDPIKPVVNPLSQIELTHINIDAQGTSPAGVDKQIVYNENLQVPTEWNTPASIFTANYDYLISPYIGLKSMNSTSSYGGAGSGLVQFNNSHNVNADTCALLSMYVLQNGVVVGTIGRTGLGTIGTLPSFYVQLLKAGVAVTNRIGITDGFYGYFMLDVGGYQNIVVPFTDFTFANSLDKTFDEILITNVAVTKSTVQFDYITIQKGGNVPPVISNYWSLNGNDNSSVPTAKLGTTSKNALSIVTNDVERINIAEDGLITIPNISTTSDTSEYKPLSIGSTGEVSKMTSWGNNTVYTINPIMSMVSNDSNIVYFNADTAAAWRSGGTIPNLQQVTDSGNTTTNDIFINQLGLYDGADAAYGTILLNDSRFTFKNSSGIELFNYELYGGLTLTDGYTNYGTIHLPSTFTTNRTYDLPDASGTLALSVNGNFADSSGNITISTGGSSPNLQQVLDSGNVADYKSLIIAGGFTPDSVFLIPGSADGLTEFAQVKVSYHSVGDPENYIKMGVVDGYANNKPYIQGLYTDNGFKLNADTLSTFNTYIGGGSNLIFKGSLGNYHMPNDNTPNDTLATLQDVRASSGGGVGTVYVDSIYRTVGKDSIFYKKNGNTYAIKDSVGTNPAPVGYYGAFSDTTSQTAVAINTGYAMKFALNDITPNGISMVVNGGGNKTRITFANTGIYNLQWSAQFTSTDNAENDVSVWLRKNGTDVVGSRGLISVPKKIGLISGHALPSWNFVLSVVVGEYYEFVWSTSNTNVSIDALPLTAYAPSTASTILTVTQQSGIMAGTGITAINSLTGAAQTMVTGTDSTDFKIVSTGTTHKFNLPTASATKRGALSSTDWSTFNNKIGAADTSVFLRKTDSSTYYTKYRSDTSRTNIYTAINNKVADSAWVDCSSLTLTGWSATTTKVLQYRKLGNKTVIFMFEIVGTGTGLGASIATMPFTTTSWGSQATTYIATQSTAAVGYLQMPASSSTLTFFPSIAGGNFVSGQIRNLKGQVTFNIQ